jgi:hypothetical protein
MKMRTWFSAVFGAFCMVAVMLVGCSGAQQAAKPTEAVSDREMDDSMMGKMMKEKMQSAANLKALLKGARGDAEAKGATVAVEKIDTALAQIDAEHKSMHEKMAAHKKVMMEKMARETDPAKKARMEKKMQDMKDMKCPMCAEN